MADRIRRRIPCRLCFGESEELFRAAPLGRDTGYHRCTRCGSLQTDAPDWLEITCESSYLSLRDAGAVERCLRMQAAVWSAARALGLPDTASILDFGGGNGLLCRLLRDIGFDAHVEDAHATPHFAQPFVARVDERRFDLVTMIEVAEHLPDPGEVFQRIFKARPGAVMVGTETYKGQGKDWHYLALEDGQHVFFYSQGAMRYLAETHGYAYIALRDVHLFTAAPVTEACRRRLAKRLRGWRLRFTRARIAWRSTYDRAAADCADIDRRIAGESALGRFRAPPR